MSAPLECPVCHAHALEVEFRLEAKDIGKFSLSGAQVKFSATEVPYVVCRACGIEKRIM